VDNKIHLGFDLEWLGNILESEFEVPIPPQVIEVSLEAGEQIIQANNGGALGEEAIAHMRTHKPSRSRDDGAFFSQNRHNLECSTQAPPCQVDKR